MIGSRTVRERGQGIIEFAVIFPIFAFLLFAVIDGGLVMGRYNNANQAAGVGARLAATGTSLGTVRARIDDQMHDEMDNLSCGGNNDRICINYRDGPDGQDAGDVGSLVEVYVRYEYDLLTPVLANVVAGGDWEIEACSIQRLEQPVEDAEDIDDPSSSVDCD
jgi:Flp pilus assembly protein TadG